MMNTEQFPLIDAAVKAVPSGYRQTSLSRVLEIINIYAEAESIPNPEFKNAKDALSTAVDVVSNFDGIYGDAFRSAYKFEVNQTVCLDFMYANQVAGKLKLAIKNKFDNAQWFAICTEIVSIYDALMALKSKIMKRKGRSEEEKADDYVPPMPTTKAAMEVLAILKTMTDDLTKEYEEILFNSYVTSVQYRMDNPVKRDARYTPTHADFLMNKVGEGWDGRNGGNYTRLVPNFRTILRAEATKDSSFAQRMFLYKNVTKLAVILEKKGNFSSHKIIDGRVNSQGFQGEIVFGFADGSQFTVRNKVIVNVSVHGKAFNQYPTTFHDAVMPNKEVIVGQPSQEEMIEKFSGATA